MSELKTNKISTNDQNNVAIDNALGLKSYTTTQRDALTSVAGDMIYNSTDSKVQVYSGSAWEDLGGIAAFDLEYVIVGGGGSSGSVYGASNMGSGGGGAGGYISSVIGENSGGGLSSHQVMYVALSTNYPVSIGAGGTAASSGTLQEAGYQGTYSHFNNIIASGGGAGQSYGEPGISGRTGVGGSGGGRGTYYNRAWASKIGPNGLDGQGYAGGDAVKPLGAHANATGGGGGAGAEGGDGNASSYVGGNGGDGVQTSITGTATYLAGGGAGSGWGNSSTAATGGQGGGGDGAYQANGTNGTDNTGGGAGGM